MRKLLIVLVSIALVAIISILAYQNTDASTQAVLPSADQKSVAAIQPEVQPTAVDTGYVTAPALLNLRETLDGNSRILGELLPGDEVAIFEFEGDKVLVGADDLVGWTLSKYINVGPYPVESGERGISLRDADCYNNPCWVTNDTWFTPAPQHTIGKAVYYDYGLMEATARLRGMDLTGFKGGVAMANAADIGQVVWLRVGNEAWQGPYLVVDCSQRNHVWEHTVLKRQSVEVDYNTAIEWGMVVVEDGQVTVAHGGRPNVEVWKGVLPPTDEHTPIPYYNFIMDTAEVTYGYAPNRQWSIAYAKFTNYEDYLKEIE